MPDQSDWSDGAQDMHKNAQKVEWKTQSKISCHYTWLLRGQICLSHGAFLRSFLTASKPSRRLITAAKRKGKEKEEKKKNSKIDFCSCLSPNVVKRDGSGKKGKLLCCKCQSLDQIKANLAEIQPENHQNVQKTHFWQKAARVNGLILNKIKSISWQNTDIHWLALKPLTTFVNIISWMLSIGNLVELPMLTCKHTLVAQLECSFGLKI